MNLLKRIVLSIFALSAFLPLFADGTESKTLIAYFSQTGTTERMAQYIQNATGADLFRIEPAEPYTRNGTSMNDIDKIAKEEIEKNIHKMG